MKTPDGKSLLNSMPVSDLRNLIPQSLTGFSPRKDIPSHVRTEKATHHA